MKKLLLIALISNFAIAQTDYPKDYFRSPLNITVQLSGCFGELRANHFHSGLDIKTNKIEGLNVYAVADGYVSRIKISTYGYGKAVYITHPNGFTTLYGHLSKMNGEIEKYLKTKQYDQTLYEVELFLKPNELPVKKSDVIAFSGNTGGSGGPHLHFEFRNSLNDDIINPMFFGFDKLIKDTISPKLNGLFLYPIDDKSIINQSNMPIVANLSLQKDGSYLAEKVLLSGKMGFGINVFDQFNNSYNKYGIYKVTVTGNGKNVFEYEFNSFAFEQFRYINALIDYPRYEKTEQRVQKLFMKNSYPLSIIKTDETNGIVTANTPNVTQLYKIEISDFHKNKTIINIPIEYSLMAIKNIAKPIISKYFIKHKTDNIFEKENVEVFFPKNIFYDDFNMNFDVKNDTIIIHNETVPVHANYTISITDNKHSASQMTDYFIGKLEKNKIEYVNTIIEANVFKAKTRELGTFVLAQDTIKPKVNIVVPVEGKIITNQKNIQFKISDDKSGIKSYDGFLNGRWILFEYEYKNKTITYNFDEGTIEKGLNNLRLVVIDNVGNLTNFETEFFYNP
jgi:murein DD-endopeptidase MepM/ murein hydrolase activator NlpD